MEPVDLWTYPVMMVSKWQIGEYLAIFWILFVTLVVTVFRRVCLRNLAHLSVIVVLQKTIPPRSISKRILSLLNSVQHRKFRGDTSKERVSKWPSPPEARRCDGPKQKQLKIPIFLLMFFLFVGQIIKMCLVRSQINSWIMWKCHDTFGRALKCSASHPF